MFHFLQEIVIQQLQDEANRLRQQLRQRGEESSAFERMRVDVRADSQTSVVVELQRKLRSAVKDIQQLATDKQQLIELGNRLRADLQRCTCGQHLSKKFRNWHASVHSHVFLCRYLP